MPILTINIPHKSFLRLKEQARRNGFKDPTEWAKILVEKNIGFEESPRVKPSKIVSEMTKTGLYKMEFLRELKKSIEYADTVAQ